MASVMTTGLPKPRRYSWATSSAETLRLRSIWMCITYTSPQDWDGRRNPDIQEELRKAIAVQSSDDWLTVTVRRPTTILFRFGTVFVDAANAINPDIERHIIKSAKD